jgi:hypothetical protein
MKTRAVKVHATELIHHLTLAFCERRAAGKKGGKKGGGGGGGGNKGKQGVGQGSGATKYEKAGEVKEGY